MDPIKSFCVFGEPVQILISGDMTAGKLTTLIQTSPPGGGPPPHSHQNEDETFYVLEGEYEFLRDGEWKPAEQGDSVYAPRGSVHTFRNAGTTTGKMLVFCVPAGMDRYLEAISPLTMPDDAERLLAISKQFGIAFPGMG